MCSEGYSTWSMCLSVSVRSGTTGIKQVYERYLQPQQDKVSKKVCVASAKSMAFNLEKPSQLKDWLRDPDPLIIIV